jgi:hypothetical protein
MGFEHDRPKGANFKDSTSAPRPVRWDDEEDVRAWISALREGVEDLRGAARDRARRKRQRVLSRYEARRQIGAAWRALTVLLQAGEAGLDGPAPREPEPLPEGRTGEDEPPFSSQRPTSTPPDPAS